jgi:hypothetical protein
MYKPHTIEQYKVYRFLEENFALEHFLLAPLSRFGLILEDKTGEKIAFAFLNNCVQEIPVPAPAAPETVTAFLKQFRSNVRVILLPVRCGGLFGEETKVI